jgi:hypothetical protein
LTESLFVPFLPATVVFGDFGREHLDILLGEIGILKSVEESEPGEEVAVIARVAREIEIGLVGRPEDVQVAVVDVRGLETGSACGDKVGLKIAVGEESVEIVGMTVVFGEPSLMLMGVHDRDRIEIFSERSVY